MTDPIENLIREIPLKSVSEACDQKILTTIRMSNEKICTAEERQSLGMIAANDLPANDPSANAGAITTPSRQTRSRSKFVTLAVSMAASLLIGFFVGTQFNRLRIGDRTNSNGGPENPVSANTIAGTNAAPTQGDPLRINPSEFNKIELIENESETFIVSESLQWKNQLPIRRVETITNKKVLVTDNNSEPKKIEVPIRKVIYTLADSI